WIEERGFYALALDGEKQRVDSLTSNVGHLLWSGIVPEDRAERLAEHLVGDALFSGWGVRTMADGEAGYNPIRYHNGTVWPHDNSLIAHGLARYGFRDEAARISLATLEAATFFRYRLPEVFAGYRRTRTRFPVEYPTASSPQAWATGTPLLILRVLLEPERRGGPCANIACRPTTACLTAAELVHHIDTQAAARGIEVSSPKIYMTRLRAWKNSIRRDQDSWVEVLGGQYTVVPGEATFVDEQTVRVGNAVELSAERILIATGGRTAVPPIPGIEQVHWIDHISALELDRVPASL